MPKPNMTAMMAVQDAVEWLKENLDTLRYGRVVLSFTVHAGRVADVERTVQTRERP